MDTITVIVPIYNAEHYLPQCIDSVISQTYTNWELLLVNDGSSDNSSLVCDYYSKRDVRIKYFSKNNGGVSSARNLGLQNAKGDWIMFLDADDWISDDCFEVCINEVYENKLDAVQFGHTIVFADGRRVIRSKGETPVLRPSEYLKSNIFNVCAGGGLYKHSIIYACGISFPPSLKLAEDQIFVLTFLKNALAVRYIDRPMYFYYQNQMSAIHNKRSQDMLMACQELMKFSQEWDSAKPFADSMCLVLMLDILRNSDVEVDTITELYKMGNFGNRLLNIPKSCLVFNWMARFFPKFAVRLFSAYYSQN